MTIKFNVQSYLRDLEIQDLVASRPYLEILWPCALYTIAIKAEQNTLNLFEKAVLRLSFAKISQEQIADFLCLPLELIKFTSLRLEQKGFMRQGIISEAGKNFIKQDISEGEVISSFIYQEKIGGKFLPFVETQKPQFLLPCNEDQKGLRFYLRALGDLDHRLINPLVLKKQIFQDGLLKEPQVLEIIERFKRIHTHTPLFSGLERDMPVFMLKDNSALAVQDKAQDLMLHCICVVGKDGDLQILNPFGYADLSSELTQSLSHSPYVDEFKQRLYDKQVRFKVRHSSTSTYEVRALTGFSELDLEIFKAQNALENYSKALNDKQNEDSRHLDFYIRSFITSLYAAFECFLRRLMLENSNDNLSNILKNCSCEQIKQYAIQAAQKLGFEIDKKVVAFLTINPDEIKALLRGRSSLRSLVALNLFLATTQESLGKVLRQMASQFPFMIESLALLKEKRDPLSHGESKVSINLPKMRSLFEVFNGALQAYLPNLNQQDANATSTTLKIDSYKEPSAIEIEASLLQFFPQEKRALMSDKTLQELKVAEFYFQKYGISSHNYLDSEEKVDVQCLVALASFYQKCLQDKIAVSNASFDFKDYQERLQTSLLTAGFSLDDQKLPKALSLYDEENLNRALSYSRLTLGKAFVIYALSLDLEKLSAVAKLRSSLIKNLDLLIELRAHGEGLVSKKQASNLREMIFSDVVALLGV